MGLEGEGALCLCALYLSVFRPFLCCCACAYACVCASSCPSFSSWARKRGAEYLSKREVKLVYLHYAYTNVLFIDTKIHRDNIHRERRNAQGKFSR